MRFTALFVLSLGALLAQKRQSMREFDITQWVDFVRGVAALGEGEKMQQHLNAGCGDCAAVVQFLQQVVAASPRVTVPDNLVQAALRVFPAKPRVAEVRTQ